MNGFALVVATAVMGVDYGWQVDADGRIEYIIQIEPMTLIALREGHDIESQIHPSVGNVRRFRIRVGTEPVPQPVLPPREPEKDTSSPTPPAGVEYGWQTVDQNEMEFIVQISPERLVELHGGEEISGQMPSGLKDVVRLRVRSGTGAVPREEQSAVTQASTTQTADAQKAASAIPKPSITENQHDANQLPATVLSTTEAESGENASRSSEGTTRPWQFGAAPRDGQPSSHYRSLADTPKEDPLSLQSPRNQIPLPSLPVPEISSSEASQPRAVERGSSIYDQRTQNRGLMHQSLDPTADAPRRIDADQSTAPPIGYSPGRRMESSPSRWPGNDRPASTATSFADQNHAMISDSAADPLTSALGYEPWPSREVGYDVEVRPISAPKDFWSNLSETADDRSLDYLREKAEPFQDAMMPGASSRQINDTSHPASGRYRLAYNQRPSSWTPANQDSDGTPDESQRTGAGQPTTPPSALENDDPSLENGKRWWPLTLAVLALFASMGGNLYMGWIVADTYRKYLDLTDDLNDGDRREPAAADREEDTWSPNRNRRERRTVGV